MLLDLLPSVAILVLCFFVAGKASFSGCDRVTTHTGLNSAPDLPTHFTGGSGTAQGKMQEHENISHAPTCKKTHQNIREIMQN
jgi:hypothetical protein